MADVQVTRLQYFIHMCIVKASAICITIFIDHRVFMVLFLSKMSYSGLTTSKAFWTSMFHCFRRAAQFYQEICPRIYLYVLVRCLWSLFLTFSTFWNCSLWLVVFTVLRSDKDVRYGFKISRKHRRYLFKYAFFWRLWQFVPFWGTKKRKWILNSSCFAKWVL